MLLDHHSVVELLLGLVGSLLFGFGSPSIFCKSCAWDFGFSFCCWNAVLGKNVCNSVTQIDLGISGFLRILEACSSLRKVLRPVGTAG